MKLLAALGLIAILVPPTEFGAMPKVKAPLVRRRYQSAAGKSYPYVFTNTTCLHQHDAPELVGLTTPAAKKGAFATGGVGPLLLEGAAAIHRNIFGPHLDQ